MQSTFAYMHIRLVRLGTNCVLAKNKMIMFCKKNINYFNLFRLQRMTFCSSPGSLIRAMTNMRLPLLTLEETKRIWLV